MQAPTPTSADGAPTQGFRLPKSRFENFCGVTERIRRGIPVRVRVLDRDGLVVHEAGGAEAASAVA